MLFAIILQKSHLEVFFKTFALWKFAKFPGKNLYQNLFFNKTVKDGGWRPTFLKKETPAQAFCCQFCIMFKNICSVEQQQRSASDIIQEKERVCVWERDRERERERADFILDTRQPVGGVYGNRSCTIISEILWILLQKSSIFCSKSASLLILSSFADTSKLFWPQIELVNCHFV